MIETPVPFLYPMLRTDAERGRPVVFGTAVLLQVESAYFLVTAAHVLDGCSGEVQFMDGEELASEQAPVTTTPAPDGNRNADKIDLGFAALSDWRARRLLERGYRFVTAAQIDVADLPSPTKKYSFTGFPASRQAVRSFREQRLKLEPIEYCLKAISSPGLTAAGWIPALHIGGLFERDSMMVEPGKRITAPEPIGISGGGVWVTGATGYRLVGIGIQWDGENKMLIGVRIGALVPQLKAALGERASELPESPYLKISIQ